MPDLADLPIGIFDSGVGGLTVFKAINAVLPNESLVYLGDTARVPYGTKGHDTIVRYALMAAGALSRVGIKMLVIACNTATAAALPTIAAKLAPMPVVGVVEPGAAAAVAATRNGHIAVIATEATIRGNAYQEAIARHLPEARVIARPCTLFVPIAEEGWLDGDVPGCVAARYLGDIFAPGIPDMPDTLLLGCTHFPLLLNPLRKIAGPAVQIVDSASATAASVLAELDRLGLRRCTGAAPTQRFLTTDNLERFTRTGGMFLGRPISHAQVELVDIQDTL